MKNFIAVVEAGLELAFLAGRWAGQVDLEEHYEAEQCGIAMMESHFSRKNAMPMFPASTGRTVSINLRSDEWRKGVRKSTKEELEKAKDFIINNTKLLVEVCYEKSN